MRGDEEWKQSYRNKKRCRNCGRVYIGSRGAKWCDECKPAMVQRVRDNSNKKLQEKRRKAKKEQEKPEKETVSLYYDSPERIDFCVNHCPYSECINCFSNKNADVTKKMIKELERTKK